MTLPNTRKTRGGGVSSMKRRRMAPPKPVPIYVKGPDDDRGRTIAKLERENHRLQSVNQSLEGMMKQQQAFIDKGFKWK